MAGALVPYALGYWFGEERLRRFVKRFGWVVLLKEADLDRANRWFDKHDGKAVFISRMVPGARKVVPIPAGIACMPLKEFVAYTALGSAVSNSVFVGLGWLLGDQWFVVRRYAHLLEYGALIVLAAAILWFVWSRLKKRKRPLVTGLAPNLTAPGAASRRRRRRGRRPRSGSHVLWAVPP